jgi:hypothetical protein
MYLVVLCAGSMLPLAKQSLDEAPYKLSGAVAKLAGITFSRLAFSYWIDNLGFLLREELAAIFIIPSSWGSQLAGHFIAPSIAIILYPNEFLKIPYEHSLVHSFHQKGFWDKSNQNSFPKLHAILRVCKVLVL